MNAANRRNLLIALNCAPHLSRESICRLALEPERWLSRGRPSGTAQGRAAAAVRDIETARRVARGARRLSDAERTRCGELGGRLLTLADAEYPAALRDLELPPPVLYVRGRLPDSPAVAIVGSRRATRSGLEIAELFGRELACLGLTVVSGFARGIDAAAHRGALAGGGLTVAVLGCGLDVDYPRGRRRLTRRIARRGALVTEFPLGSRPLARNFPVRNRIIAAMALGTLVVQATPRSGSLITARLALDLGRDVYAVPGPILEERSTGPNTLIRDGALLVQHPRDIVESLPSSVREELREPSDSAPPAAPSAAHAELLRHLPGGELVSVEQLAARAGRSLERVLAELLELELAGLVRRCAGSTYCRRP